MKKLFAIKKNEKNEIVEKFECKVSERKFAEKAGFTIVEEEVTSNDNQTRTLALLLSFYPKKGDNGNFSSENLNLQFKTVQPVKNDNGEIKENETVRQNSFYMRTIRETIKGLRMLGYDVPSIVEVPETPATDKPKKDSPEKDSPEKDSPEKDSPEKDSPEKETPKTDKKAK